MFRLNNVEFEINDTESIFYINNGNENGLSFALDIDCKAAEYDGENVTPSICINYFETDAKSIQDLNGMESFVNSLEESDEREDTMYLFEHEPFEKYSLKILESKDDRVRVFCKGVVVTNGYSEPYISAPFELDTWIKIK
ncbi:hypothetical protein [Clostridium sp. FP1]|uniref:hypothetical protein n=1 Tax=Clostridium sp. FP1 TaxID=2724076 RepID=UPI0013E98DC2|nr:hypothetical protein [Clostridium sp. FP1]MBZ9634873.1 hypothetical protein [Clostridium sp. FP1]